MFPKQIDLNTIADICNMIEKIADSDHEMRLLFTASQSLPTWKYKLIQANRIVTAHITPVGCLIKSIINFMHIKLKRAN